MSWQPSPVPSELEELRGFLQRELADVAAEFRRVRSMEFLAVAPTKPREGDTAGADGTHWNPGEGQGVYTYFGGAWRLLGGLYSYGEMRYGGTPITITVSAANTAYEVTSGLSAGAVARMTFGGSHYLQVTDAGVYAVNWSASLTDATANDSLAAGLMVNGTADASGHFHGVVANASKAITLSGSGILSLAANDQVSFFVENHTSASNITVDAFNLVAHRIY